MTIDWLQDINTGDKFYPITHEDAVIDNSGNTISSKIELINNRINGVPYKKLAEKFYEPYTCTADTKNDATIFFMNVIPTSDNWFTPWSIKYRLYVTTDEQYTQSWHDCQIGTAGSSLIYSFFNNMYSTGYISIYNHEMLWYNSAAKYNDRQTNPIKIGERIYSSRSVTTLARTIKIEVYEAINCTFEILDNFELFGNVYTAEKYGYDSQIIAYSNGLQETGDASYPNYFNYDYFNSYRIHSTETPLYRYKLCGFDTLGRIVPITSTNQTNATIVPKTPNTVPMDVSKGIVYYNTTTTISAVETLLPTATIYRNFSQGTNPCPYNFNSNPVVGDGIYLVGNYSNGLFTLDTTSANSYYLYVQNVGDDSVILSNFTTGKYYWYLGDMTSSGINFLLDNPLYYFDGTSLIPYVASELNKKEISSNKVATFGKNSLPSEYPTALAVYNAINDIQPYLIKTLKNEPDSYLKNVQYNIENNNVSYIEDYVSSSIIGSRTDQPLPVSLPSPSNSFRNIFVTPTENKQAEYIYVSDSKGKYYNLIPASRYFYRDDDGEQQSFVLESGRRFIWASNVLNIRDLGGIPTKTNGYIAYDKIIRGSELDGHYVNADDMGIEAMRSLHFTLELDLRNVDEIDSNHLEGQSEFATRYKQISFIRFENIRTLDNDEKAKIKDAFESVANEVISGGKVYIHCAWGYHRAGFLATLIEGILGATQYEIDKDYELSSFSPLGVVKRTDSNYKNGITAINEQYEGSWAKFAKACGISEELIESFRKAMIVEIQNCEDSGNQYIEITYDELKKLRDNKNLIPGAKYRMIDFDTYDGTQSDFASCSGIPDLPEFKSAYHHFDLLLTALSTNELDSNVKALHSARDTEGYFANQDLAKWELKYDLDNDKSKYSWAVNDDILVSYGDKVYYNFFSEHPLGGILRIVTIGDYSALDILLEQSPKSGKFRVIENNSKDSMYSYFAVGDEGDITTIDSLRINVIGHWVWKDSCNWIYYVNDNKYEHIEGKGVIYYMKDEYNNEVPYDFKNIMFKYKDNWYYTFNSPTSNVIIKPWIDNLGQHLNRNVFINSQIIKDCFFDFNTHDNILKDNIINVKVGMYSSNNTLINLESVKLGYDNVNIYLENFVDSNIGNECYNLELYGNDNVIIVEDFISNKIGAAVDEYTKIYNGIEYSSIKDINTRILYTNGDEKLVKIIGKLTKNDLPDFNNIKEVEIGNSVTSIEDSAFYGCLRLTSITIPDSVTSIEGFVFYNCTRLASVAIPDSVTSIGIYAFRGCSSLTSIIIPDSVTSIEDSAFSNCYNLNSVAIPDSVTSIGNAAFYGCISLTSITIPDSVTSIGGWAFQSCSGLTSIIIPDSVTSIGNAAFYGCISLTSITIPDSVTNIKDSAFYGCSNLTSITIPNSVTSIGSSAFYGCSNLTSVNIPEGVTSIGSYAFCGCSGLTSVTIPNSVTSIGYYAFQSCSSLTSVNIPNSVTSIGDYAFRDCSSLTSVTIPEGVTSIGSYAFYGCSSLTSVNIPNSVTSIGDGAFNGCSNLTSVLIPGTVTNIGNAVFYNCSSLTSVNIPEGVTRIGSSAFQSCSSLTSVNIPNSVTSIGSYAFRDCSNLTSVNIPNSVTSIGDGAFSYCSSLNSVTCMPVTPPSLGNNAIPSTILTIEVPAQSVDNYKSARGWSNYADKIIAI